MNPFTESTIACPLHDDRAWSLPFAPVARHKNRRPFSRLKRGAAGLATGLGLVAGLASAAVYALDVNTATQVQLETVRGIGQKTARIIIEERSRGGRFESFEDLSDRVKGIGPKKAAALHSAGLTLGGADNAGSSGAVPAPAQSLQAKPVVRSGKPVVGSGKAGEGASRAAAPVSSRVFKLRP